MKLPTSPWWMDDQYDLQTLDGGLPFNDDSLWGPRGPAMVSLYDDGTTSPGWGRKEFMLHYTKLQFSPRRHLHNYKERQPSFALVMRSTRLLCVDIDGKNGGFQHVGQLGLLPRTLAERSKSGNGFHLFYTVEDEWDAQDGFNKYKDVIGLVPGVDIRAVGCVFHKPTQRWNHRELAPIPQHLDARLLERVARREQQAVNIAKMMQQDPEEILIMQYELLEELKKPIQAGSRNNTLFAIGSKLKQAQVPDWEKHVEQRGVEVGLDDEEIDRLLANINRYEG